MTGPKSLIPPAISLPTIFALALAVTVPAQADYTKGIAAYQRGQYTRAAMELTSSAVRGEARAQTALGLLYELGEGVAQDYVTAADWYTRAAKRGYAEAQYNLGHLYELGLGVVRDDDRALSWYEPAAKAGHATAQYNLGLRYQTGNGLPRDLVKALHWYQKAAVNGEPNAAVNLGYLYATGQGVATDRVLAYAWYSAPGTETMTAAVAGRKLLEAELSETQIAKAREMAKLAIDKQLAARATAKPVRQGEKND